MSIKAMNLVWEFECPQTINGIVFKPNHKFVLQAYADHADHEGKNIYPSVATVAQKTGYVERSVQRITAELELMCLLIPDGVGRMGTNKWMLPFNDGGDKLTPQAFYQGDRSNNELGDIPSGDIPSGDDLTPELKEPETKDINKIKDELIEKIELKAKSVFHKHLDWMNWKRQLEKPTVDIYQKDDDSIAIATADAYDSQFSLADLWETKYQRSFANIGLQIDFITLED